MKKGRIYNIFRGQGFNPNITWSDDQVETWTESFELIRSGDHSTRPYVKYCSDGKGRIDLLYTDGHPRNEKNNIYHIYYQDGWFHKSDGTKIRTMEECRDNPIEPKDGTMVYEGSTHEKGRGWVWDLEYDALGNPVAAYISIVKYNGSDIRYRYARWNPESKQWTENEISHAGRGHL